MRTGRSTGTNVHQAHAPILQGVSIERYRRQWLRPGFSALSVTLSHPYQLTRGSFPRPGPSLLSPNAATINSYPSACIGGYGWQHVFTPLSAISRTSAIDSYLSITALDSQHLSYHPRCKQSLRKRPAPHEPRPCCPRACSLRRYPRFRSSMWGSTSSASNSVLAPHLPPNTSLCPFREWGASRVPARLRVGQYDRAYDTTLPIQCVIGSHRRDANRHVTPQTARTSIEFSSCSVEWWGSRAADHAHPVRSPDASWRT